MKITKDYIIEGYYLKAGTDIEFDSSVVDEPLVGTITTTGLNNVTEEEMEVVANKYIQLMRDLKLLADDSNGIENAKKVKDYVTHLFQQDGEIDENKVIKYTKTLGNEVKISAIGY